MAERKIPCERSVVIFDGLPRTRKDAKACGAQHYFTGTECKHGHIDKRYTSTGSCAECARVDLRARYKCDPQKARGYQRSYIHRKKQSGWVRDGREYYEKNREILLSNAREYYERERSSILEKKREYREENAGLIRKRAVLRRAANVEEARKKDRAQRAKRPDLANIRSRKWRSANPEKVRTFSRNRKARNKNAEGFHSAGDVDRIRSAQNDKCAYCKAELGGRGHVDHIIALARGGTNWPRNLQLLCAACNLSKSARDPIEFARDMGKLI